MVRMPALIELHAVRKSYGGHDGEPAVEVLHGIDLTIRAGEFIALMGASGSGKSTLMHILGCLDRPNSGRYLFAGHDIASLGADELAWLRREAFGFVFQGYHLVRTLDALHNVQAPPSMPVCRPPSAPPALRRCWNGWGWVSGPGIARTSFQAVSSSASPSPAP